MGPFIKFMLYCYGGCTVLKPYIMENKSVHYGEHNRVQWRTKLLHSEKKV